MNNSTYRIRPYWHIAHRFI